MERPSHRVSPSSHCTASVDRALRDVSGVLDVSVDLDSKLATVLGTAEIDALLQACANTGKTAELVSSPFFGLPNAQDGMQTASAANGANGTSSHHATPPPQRTGRTLQSPDPNAESGNGSFSRKRENNVRVRQPDAAFKTGSSPLMERMSAVSRSMTRVIVGKGDDTVMLSIRGMTCAACVGAVERALVGVPGVREVSVSLMGKRGQVFYSPDLASPPLLVDAVKEIGFEASELNPDDEVSPSTNFSEEMIYYRGQFFGSLPLALGAVLTAKVLPNTGPQPVQDFLAQDVIPGLSVTVVLVVAFVTPVQFYFGLPFYRKAWSALKHGATNMDVLVVLGTSVAYVYSLFFTFLSISTAGSVGRDDTCFETSAMLINFMLLGKYLETSAKGRASEAVSQLLSLQPPTALKVQGGQSGLGTAEVIDNVPAASLLPGDVVKVLPGATVPADGVVVQGSSAVNESMITGESVPVPKELHDNTVGGSVNGSGVLWIKVGAVGADSVLSKIMKLVSDAQMRKPEVQAFADRVAQYFVPTVVVLAILTWSAWALALVAGLVSDQLISASGLADGNTMAFMFGAATLVIACPCALGLATPTAVMVGSGVGAQLGILFKGGDSLEDAANVTAVLFDKTGTLTKGALEVGVVATWAPGMSHDALLRLASSAECHSEHPIGQAVVSAARSRNLAFGAVSNFMTASGLGLTCAVDGLPLLLGNRAWLLQHGHALNAQQEADAAKREGLGETVILLAVDGVVAGMLALSDVLQTDSEAVVDRLTQMGIEVWMATGDNYRTAAHVAYQLGIPGGRVLADAKPREKREKVAELQAAGHVVAMVGDGVNDAPALAEVSCGVCVVRGLRPERCVNSASPLHRTC
jgi:Cu+-exporting ATPase